MSDIIYVNWANKCASQQEPELDPCVSTWCAKDPDALFELLDLKIHSGTEIYFGPEFHKNLEKIEQVISWCNKQNKVPVLFTDGSWINDETQCVSTLNKIKKSGDCRIMILVDSEREPSFSASHLSHFIREAKERFIFPEMMCIGSKSSFPLYLYESEEVKKTMSVYFNHATSTKNFFDNFKNIDSAFKDTSPPSDKTLSASSVLMSSSEPASSTSTPDNKLSNFINFNAIVLETTYLCNSKCDHCYTSCGPQADRTLMPLDKIERTLQEAAAIDCINKRVHVAGGEPTLFWDHMETILCIARDLGYMNSIVTNGHWGADREKAQKRVQQLKEAGVVEIEISIDAMHQQHIDNKSIHHILEAVEQYDIQVILSLCTTRYDNILEVLGQVDTRLLNNVNITTRQVVAIGRAKRKFAESDFYVEKGIPTGSCEQLLTLTIDPSGNVYPCCGGSELCPSLRMGNCFSESLLSVLEKSKSDALLRTLIHKGPSYFADMLRKNGHEKLLRSTYGNFCHLCNDIFSDKEKTQVVQDLFFKR